MSSKTVASVEEALVQDVELLPRAAASAARLLPPYIFPAKNPFAVSRTDIEFFNVAPGSVAIEIKVTNQSNRPSPPSMMQIQAAPFGAFVPWQRLAMIDWPSLAPRKTRHARWRADIAQTQPLGSPADIGPRDLLTAFGLADEPPNNRDSRRFSTEAKTSVPPGLLDLLKRETPHWAGNIEVLIGRTQVERHQGQALRVYPGRLNTAWFIVGTPHAVDAYAFQLDGVETDWEAGLFDITSHERLVIGVDKGEPIAPEQWIAGRGSRVIVLALRVPKNCAATKVAVNVFQRSTGRKAVVEFGLDPNAAGRGCYAV